MMKLYTRPNGRKYWYEEKNAPADAVLVEAEKPAEVKAKEPANKAKKPANKSRTVKSK